MRKIILKISLIGLLIGLADKTIAQTNHEPCAIDASSGNKPSASDLSQFPREDIEWINVWLPNTNDKDLPRVLLIGNSITQSYYGKVQSLLEGKAYTGRLTTSKSLGDPALLAEIELVLRVEKFDIIHFNNGLHGFVYSEDEYRKSFPDLLKTIREYAPKARLIWASTTPIRTGDGMKEFAEGTARVKARNQIALEAIQGQNILLNDLFRLVEEHPDYYAGGDGVHLVDVGVTALANQVASVILNIINQEFTKNK
jgi:lysophospholipase L1-like esterase